MGDGGSGRALNVLILQPDASSYGACRALLRTLTAMPEGAVRATVVFPYGGDAVKEYEAAGCRVAIEHLAVLRRHSANPRGLARLALDARRSGQHLANLAQREAIDLVHTNSMTVVSGARAASRARVPHVWQLREAPREGGARLRVLRWLLRHRADLVVAVSEAAARVAGAMPVEVVYDGYDADDVSAARTVAPDSFLVGMVGRVSPTKAQHVAVEAIAQPELASAVLGLAGTVFPGNEWYARDVLQQAKQLGVADRVHAFGWLEDGARLIRQLDALLIATAHGEGFPASVLEALALGVPVVNAATGGVDELVIHEQTGLRATPGDARSIATQLARLRDDQELRERLTVTGRAHAARWSTRASAERMLEVWQMAVQRS